jgi:hypothetical protein
MPEIDSMSEDFPALCEPSTAMTGMSRSRWALGEGRKEVSRGSEWGLLWTSPRRAKAIDCVKHAALLSNILGIRKANSLRGVHRDGHRIRQATRNVEVTAEVGAAVRLYDHRHERPN